MFCYQCQEAAKGTGCTIQGVCGKKDDVAKLQDLLIYTLKGIALCATNDKITTENKEQVSSFITNGLFSTITNVNFDRNYFIKTIQKGLKLRNHLKETHAIESSQDEVTWDGTDEQTLLKKADDVGVFQRENNEDKRSLKELITYGLKGLAAYYHHATVLDETDPEIESFMIETLAILTKDQSVDELVQLTVSCGEYSVKTMALLDTANTKNYGNPEPTQVSIDVGTNPGILISGHDLKDMEELLKQTQGTGVDVYTHGEMLPANAYPVFKKYDHFKGNYGNSWWQQTKEFESFNGPILMTTNCLVPPKESYKNRVYTTGVVGFDGVNHIPDEEKGNPKDFSDMIAHAQNCEPPVKMEDGEITVGFAHNATLTVADKIVEAVKNGDINRFIVMAGCDGRHKDRQYYTDFAKALPQNTVILTAGCAKYRYNKLDLGDIGGIPRILDAGQCNDSYSLVVIAQKLAEAFGVDINELPISYNIAWYEQKAVTVLLALLSLGVKNIMLGPTLPAFVSPNVLNVLVENFNIMPNSTVEKDLETLVPTMVKEE